MKLETMPDFKYVTSRLREISDKTKMSIDDLFKETQSLEAQLCYQNVLSGTVRPLQANFYDEAIAAIEKKYLNPEKKYD